MEYPLAFDFNHKYVIQSYIFTTAKYDYSIEEKRILYRLVEYAQDEIEGLKIKDHMYKVHHRQNDVQIIMPIASVLIIGEKNDYNKNYDTVKKACKALGTKYFEWEDNGVYRGFRKFDLAIAMKLKSTYSMRLFEIMSGQTTPLELTVSEIREMFRLEKKYNNIKDLQRRVLKAASNELDRVSPYSFEFKKNYIGNKIVSFTLFPIFIAANQDEKLVKMEQQAKVTARLQLDQRVYDYLKISYGFKSEEINKNKKTLLEGQKTIVNFIDFIANLRPNAIHASKPKAYIIGAIQRALRSAADIKNAKRQGSNFHNSDNAIKDRVHQLVLNFTPR